MRAVQQPLADASQAAAPARAGSAMRGVRRAVEIGRATISSPSRPGLLRYIRRRPRAAQSRPGVQRPKLASVCRRSRPWRETLRGGPARAGREPRLVFQMRLCVATTRDAGRRTRNGPHPAALGSCSCDSILSCRSRRYAVAIVSSTTRGLATRWEHDREAALVRHARQGTGSSRTVLNPAPTVPRRVDGPNWPSTYLQIDDVVLDPDVMSKICAEK